MTLVLSYTCFYFSVSISDRLVTRAGRPYDQLSNKAIVCHAGDVIATVGYTGSAYVGALPTDEWLARIICGDKDRAWRPVQPISFAVSDLPRSRRSLVARIVHGLRDEAHDSELQIGITGCRHDRGIIWPYNLVIGKAAASTEISFGLQPRWLTNNFRYASTYVSGGWAVARSDLWGSIHSRLGAIDVYQPNAAQLVEQSLIDGLRLFAQEEGRSIGAECLSIIHQPHLHQTTIRFVPTGAIPIQTFPRLPWQQPMPGLFLPWIIADTTVLPPSQLLSSEPISLRTRGYDFLLLGAPPTPSSPDVFALMPHMRTGGPR